MSAVLDFLKGKKTYFILAAALLTALPEWATSLPEGVGIFSAMSAFFGKFYPILAGATFKAGFNRLANGG